MSDLEPLDHAAAHERIEDLLLEPALLAALDASTAPDDAALRHHLAGCTACSADLEAWRRLQKAVAGALPRPVDERAQAQAVAPLELPPSLRAGVLGAARDAEQSKAGASEAAGAPVSPSAGPVPISRARRRPSQLGPWIGLAAGFIVLVSGGLIAVDQMGQRAAAEASVQELHEALAVVDRMLATDHKVVELRSTGGASAGTISWSRHEWVVLTRSLEPPAGDSEYLCWLETDGRNVPIGRMEFAGPTAYWVASLDEWQTWEIGPTTRFVVTLEPAGAEERSGPAILEARLSS
jgi:hypothetical protein